MEKEELYTKIKDQIEEKSDDLRRIKIIPFEYAFKDDDKKFFLTHSIPIIYAVWEGYVSKVMGYYLQYLNRLKIETTNIDDILLLFVAENGDTKIKNYPNEEPKKINYLLKLKELLSNKYIVLPEVINTQDNLGFIVVNNILKSLCLGQLDEMESCDDIPEEVRKVFFENIPIPKYPLAKELGGGGTSLLYLRNQIAHGGTYSIGINEQHIQRFTFLVNYLIEQIFEKIKEAIDNKTYLKIEFRNT